MSEHLEDPKSTNAYNNGGTKPNEKDYKRATDILWGLGKKKNLAKEKKKNKDESRKINHNLSPVPSDEKSSEKNKIRKIFPSNVPRKSEFTDQSANTNANNHQTSLQNTTPPSPPEKSTHSSRSLETETSQSAGEAEPISTDGKNIGLQSNPNSHHNESIKTNTSEPVLPQQIPQEERKEKEKEKDEKLLQFYEATLRRVREFKTGQAKMKDEIECRKKETEELRLTKEKNAKLIKDLQVELYDLLKQVKVTDDDLSTIQKKLAALSGKLSNFPPNSKKSFNKKGLTKPEVIKFFEQCWIYKSDCNTENVNDLFGRQQDIDYALVSVLVEKLVMEYFVSYIFKKPIYMNFDDINRSYEIIQDLFIKANHPEWASNLRLKCVKATLTDIEKGGEAEERSKKAKAKLYADLLEKLSAIYDKDEIASRIKKLVDMATDLSFPMNSQEERIKIKHLQSNEVFYTNQVKPQYGSDKSPTMVKLGISPVFLIKNTIHIDEDNVEEEDDDYDNFTNDEDGEENEGDKPKIGYYKLNDSDSDNDYTLVYTGRAIGIHTDETLVLHKPNETQVSHKPNELANQKPNELLNQKPNFD